jgi:hypothetical protein
LKTQYWADESEQKANNRKKDKNLGDFDFGNKDDDAASS